MDKTTIIIVKIQLIEEEIKLILSSSLLSVIASPIEKNMVRPSTHFLTSISYLFSICCYYSCDNNFLVSSIWFRSCSNMFLISFFDFNKKFVVYFYSFMTFSFKFISELSISNWILFTLISSCFYCSDISRYATFWSICLRTLSTSSMKLDALELMLSLSSWYLGMETESLSAETLLMPGLLPMSIFFKILGRDEERLALNFAFGLFLECSSVYISGYESSDKI